MCEVENASVREEDVIQLRIKASNRPDAVFTLPGTIVPLENGLDPKLTRDNLLASRYVYLCPELKDQSGNPALIFVGWAYASDPGSLRILWPDASGSPVTVFASDAFDLMALGDNRQAGPTVIGRSSLAEGMGEGLETYDPISVLRIGADRKAVYDLALSRSYNQQHYCWTDAMERKGLLVVTNSPDGKAKLLPEAEARKLAAANRPKPD